MDGAGAGVLYQIIEKDGKFSSKPVEHGLVIKPHDSIELSPSTYQFRFENITKALTEDSMIDGTLAFEKLHSVPVHFMVEPDDTAPKEDEIPITPTTITTATITTGYDRGPLRERLSRRRRGCACL